MADPETLQTGPAGPGARRPPATPAVIGLVVAVVAALALAGYAFVRSRGDVAPSPSPRPAVTARPSASPGKELVLPPAFGAYERDGRTTVETPVKTSGDVATASAYYDRNGVRQVLLIGAEPVFDLELFMLSVGLSDITPVGAGFCGTYSEVELCAALTDQLAVGLVGLTDQSKPDLVALAAQAGAAF